MKNNSKTDLDQFLKQTRQHIETLINGIPFLNQHLNQLFPDRNDSQADILQQIPLTITEVQNKPVVSIAFCGPSGAGKSTVFNLLTGMNIPAGGAVRPMTHASLAVVPACISDEIIWNQLFPGFAIEQLVSPNDLRNPAAPTNMLFCGTYIKEPATKDFWPCLVDVPDFNTTAISNWEKAEQMFKRADSVIFTVYHEAYKSQKTFEIMKKVLLLSGSMVYLLTKLDPENLDSNAMEIRKDLLLSASADPDFQQRRSDGTTLLDYLHKIPFFFSPYERATSLDSIKPLANADSNLSAYILGQSGLAVLLRRQLQSVTTGIKSSSSICEQAHSTKQNVAGQIAGVEKQLTETAVRITGEEFPVFHILAMIRKLLEENRPSIIQRAFKPLLMLGAGIKAVITGAKNALSKVSGKELVSGVLLRNELERSRLQKEVELLIDEWRGNAELKLPKTEAARQLAARFLQIELPAVDSEWEESVLASLKDWQKSNKNIWLWLNVINDLFILLGTGLFVADFFLDGGMGTLGIVAVIGGSGATGGLLLSLFNNMGLGSQILQAHRNWKALRQKEYARHLQEHFAGPLFLNELMKLNQNLDADLIDRCSESCRQLKEIIRQNEQTSA